MKELVLKTKTSLETQIKIIDDGLKNEDQKFHKIKMNINN